MNAPITQWMTRNMTLTPEYIWNVFLFSLTIVSPHYLRRSLDTFGLPVCKKWSLEGNRSTKILYELTRNSPFAINVFLDHKQVLKDGTPFTSASGAKPRLRNLRPIELAPCIRWSSYFRIRLWPVRLRSIPLSPVASWRDNDELAQSGRHIWTVINSFKQKKLPGP